MASGPPCSFLRAFGSKDGGPEATATFFRQSSGEGTIQFSACPGRIEVSIVFPLLQSA